MGISVLLRRVQPSRRRLETTWFIVDIGRRRIYMDRGEDNLLVDADPSLNQVPAIVIFGHPDWRPVDDDTVSFADRPNICGRPVEV